MFIKTLREAKPGAAARSARGALNRKSKAAVLDDDSVIIDVNGVNIIEAPEFPIGLHSQMAHSTGL